MPRRSDVLIPPKKPTAIRLTVAAATRNKLRVIAAKHGYTMSALMRLVADGVADDPRHYLEKIPKNPRKQG